jgi:chromosome segregation ATPase
MERVKPENHEAFQDLQAQLQRLYEPAALLRQHIDTTEAGIANDTAELQQHQRLLDSAEDDPDSYTVNPEETVRNVGYASLQDYNNHMQAITAALPGRQALLAQLRQQFDDIGSAEQQILAQMQALREPVEYGSDDSTGTVEFEPEPEPDDEVDGSGIFRRLRQHVDDHSSLYTTAAAGALALGVGSYFNPDSDVMTNENMGVGVPPPRDQARDRRSEAEVARVRADAARRRAEQQDFQAQTRGRQQQIAAAQKAADGERLAEQTRRARLQDERQLQQQQRQQQQQQQREQAQRERRDTAEVQAAVLAAKGARNLQTPKQIDQYKAAQNELQSRRQQQRRVEAAADKNQSTADKVNSFINLFTGNGMDEELVGAGSPLALELGLDVLRGDGYAMEDNLVQR